jgi:hypothetical protein
MSKPGGMVNPGRITTSIDRVNQPDEVRRGRYSLPYYVQQFLSLGIKHFGKYGVVG